MAGETGISKSSVNRYLRAFKLKPHRVERFKLSVDPFFIEKLRDVVRLYLNPPDNALVLCVGKKSQCQALMHSYSPLSSSRAWGHFKRSRSGVALSQHALAAVERRLDRLHRRPGVLIGNLAVDLVSTGFHRRKKPGCC